MQPVTDNVDPIEYWNGPTAQKWIRYQERLDEAIAGYSERALSQLGAAPDESILDVGCGTGTTLLRIARAVGSSGHVTGLDVSAPMLRRARERTAALPHVRLVQGDAAHVELPRRFDALFSRFGVMFFHDPLAAFTRLRSALEPGGRLTFLCWQPIERNAWVMDLMKELRELLPPAPPPSPTGPGPFSLGDASHLATLVAGAGFDEVQLEGLELPLCVSTTGVEGAVDFTANIGPAARAIAEHGAEMRPAIEARLRTLMEQTAVGDRVELGSAAWLVSAVRPRE